MRGCMTSHNHKLGNRWRWEVTWTSWPLYYRERAHAGRVRTRYVQLQFIQMFLVLHGTAM